LKVNFCVGGGKIGKGVVDCGVEGIGGRECCCFFGVWVCRESDLRQKLSRTLRFVVACCIIGVNRQTSLKISESRFFFFDDMDYVVVYFKPCCSGQSRPNGGQGRTQR